MEGSTIRFRTFEDCAKDRIMGVPVKISRDKWQRGIKVSVYPTQKILEEPEIPLWVRTVYESITGLYVEITNPDGLDWDMQIRYGFISKACKDNVLIKPWEAKPQPTPQQTAPEPYHPAPSRYENPLPKCPRPGAGSYGVCQSPCELRPCPRGLGPLDPGPHNYYGWNDPRGRLPGWPDDPRGPR